MLHDFRDAPELRAAVWIGSCLWDLHKERGSPGQSTLRTRLGHDLLYAVVERLVVLDHADVECGEALNVSFNGLYRRAGHLPADVTSFVSRAQRCDQLYRSVPTDNEDSQDNEGNQGTKELASALKQVRCATLPSDAASLFAKHEADLVAHAALNDAMRPLGGTESSLCEPGEERVFSCHGLEDDEKVMSLCASPSLMAARSVLIFRMREPGKPDLEYPKPRRPAKAAFLLRDLEGVSILQFETELTTYDLEVGYALRQTWPRDGGKAKLACAWRTPEFPMVRLLRKVIPLSQP